MPMIDSQPLAEQLTRIHAANARFDALVEASRGQHVTDSNVEHTERIRSIDEAQEAYHLELVRLSPWCNRPSSVPTACGRAPRYE